MADATREKILRKAAEMGYKQFAYLPLFQEDAAKAAPFILPSDKREKDFVPGCLIECKV